MGVKVKEEHNMSMSICMHFTNGAKFEGIKLSSVNMLDISSCDDSKISLFLTFEQLRELRDSIDDYLDAEDKGSHQVVILSTSGHTIVFKGSKNECKEYCDLYEWIYVDKCGFDWDLEIEEIVNE